MAVSMPSIQLQLYTLIWNMLWMSRGLLNPMTTSRELEIKYLQFLYSFT